MQKRPTDSSAQYPAFADMAARKATFLGWPNFSRRIVVPSLRVICYV